MELIKSEVDHPTTVLSQIDDLCKEASTCVATVSSAISFRNADVDFRELYRYQKSQYLKL